jgi:glyoxylase I family protein
VEFTVDHPEAERINATRRTSAHADLSRWLGGDHTSNNTYR